jgi:WD40 repeat protein
MAGRDDRNKPGALLDGTAGQKPLATWGEELGRIMDPYAPRTAMEHEVLENYRSFVDTVAFTPGRDSILVISARCLSLWDLACGKCLWTHQGDPGYPALISIAPNGKDVFVKAGRNTVERRDLATAERNGRFVCGNEEKITSMCITPDGKTLVTAGDGICLRDAETGRLIVVMEGQPGPILSLAVSPEGDHLITGGKDKTLRLWSLREGRCLWISDTCRDKITAVAFLPDGRYVAAGDDDSMFALLDRGTGQSVRTIRGRGRRVRAIRGLPDGRTIVTLYGYYASDGMGRGSSTGVVEVREKEGEAFRLLAEHVHSLDISPDGTRVALGMGLLAPGVWVDIVDPATGRLAARLGHVSDPVYHIQLAPRGDALLTRGGDDHPLKIWDLRTGHRLPNRVGQEDAIGIRNFAFLPSREEVVFSKAKSLLVMDFRTGRPVRALPVQENHAGLTVLTPDCRFLVILGGEDLVLLDLQTGGTIRHYKGFHYSPVGLSVTHDGKWIVAAYARDGARVYDLATGHLERTFGPANQRVNKMLLAPWADQVVIAGYDKNTYVFDLETGECLRTYAWEIGSLDDMALCEHGPLMAYRHQFTGRVWVRDLESGRCLLHFAGPKGLGGIVITDRHVLIGTMDHTVRFWDLDTGHLCATLYNVVHGFLWTTPADEHTPQGWLWTDREDLVHVAECRREGETIRFLALGDPRRLDYLRLHNNQEMVMARLLDKNRYLALAMRHKSAVQGQIMQCRHEIASMLPEPCPAAGAAAETA